MALLGAIFTYAIRKGIRIDKLEQGVVRFAQMRRQRRLNIRCASPSLTITLIEELDSVSGCQKIKLLAAQRPRAA